MRKVRVKQDRLTPAHKRAFRAAFCAFVAVFALAAIAVFAPAPGHAQSSDWSGIAEAQVRLVSGATATGEGDTVTLGLQFRMNKDWKVYWRSPGGAGFAPRLDWR